ncbi:hypothetical protein C8Q79DRAFT_575358 [Trametes meyenii]|nr:hypothetical protein C8Q79DRAFT_575358 [Trametes meyenii]
MTTIAPSISRFPMHTKSSSNEIPSRSEGTDQAELAANQEHRLHRELVPARTATWEFASAVSLDRQRIPVSIEEERESFFYLLLYYGVRCVRSNCTDVLGFVTNFFESWSHGPETGNFYCGINKRGSVVSSSGIPLSNFQDDYLEFFGQERNDTNHPLSNLLWDLQEILQAHYQVQREANRRSPKRFRKNYDHEAARARQAQVQERARQLSDYGAFIRIFEEILDEKWPLEDMIGDQLGPVQVEQLTQRLSNVEAIPESSKKSLSSASEGPTFPSETVESESPPEETQSPSEEPLTKRQRTKKASETTKITASLGPCPFVIC